LVTPDFGYARPWLRLILVTPDPANLEKQVDQECSHMDRYAHLNTPIKIRVDEALHHRHTHLQAEFLVLLRVQLSFCITRLARSLDAYLGMLQPTFYPRGGGPSYL
jgi:hypothetical protein